MDTTNLSDQELYAKSMAVGLAIFAISETIFKEFKKSIEELSNLTEQQNSKVFFIISYVVLFRAQQFFWDQLISNEQYARLFEKNLFDIFKESTGVDPMPHIRDFVSYVEKGEPSREVQYIGSKICNEIDKPSAILMVDICMRFNLFLVHGFYDSMKKAWEFSNE